MNPKSSFPQGANEVSALNIIEGGSARTSHVDIGTHVTNVMAPTRDVSVPPTNLNPQKLQTTTDPPRTTTDLPNQKTKDGSHLIPTPIDVTRLESALRGHPDPAFVSQLCQNLRYGARIGFQGQRAPRFSKNLHTAHADPTIVSSNLATEVSLGRVAGPFDNPPFPNFQVSPIGLVPKKHSNKFRTIFHLSFPKTGVTSINYSISQEDFSLQYVTIDDAIEGIKRFGHGCFLSKTDIESAFPLIPVHPDDYELLGMCWEGKYYYDKALPFGLWSAPFIFNQLSEALEWLLLHHSQISFACHILDDFLIIEPKAATLPYDSICQQSLSAMLLTFQNLKIPIAAGKTQGPSQVLEFMGIILDSATMQARLPADKIKRLQDIFDQFHHRRSCTLKELQSLIGTLNFACKVVPPGRPFLQRIIALTRNVKKQHHHIKLNKGFFQDLEMWKKFIFNWNGANFFLSSEWQDSNRLGYIPMPLGR